MWTAKETPYMSGNFSSKRVNFTCATNSPIRCSFVNSTMIPAFGYIYSFGQDNNKDVLLLTNTGVYRIVQSYRCGYKCMADSNFSSMDPALSSEVAQAPGYEQAAPAPERAPSYV
jgi:hypothetical protein